MLIGLTGCIVVDTERTESSWGSEAIEPENVTIQEIDAVGKLSMEDHRREGYERIAHRRGLSTAAQVHLVQAAFTNLSRDDGKVDVLTTLVRNRCFRAETKTAILDRLDDLDREDSRKEILDAMSKK